MRFHRKYVACERTGIFSGKLHTCNTIKVDISRLSSKVLTYSDYYPNEEDSSEYDQSRNDDEWMFYDVAKIHVQGGHGGKGCMALRREFRVDQGGPSGGNGGSGGDVYVYGKADQNTLADTKRLVHYVAKDGKPGMGSSRHGRRGEDLYVPVPLGTIIKDENNCKLAEINMDGKEHAIMVAKGGEGGGGNEHFKTGRHPTPQFAELGLAGQERWLNFELRLLADIGIIGIPNAGKSTFITAVSNSKAKVADYAFTTVVPNLGMCSWPEACDKEGTGILFADIPGLVEGAHLGLGLGTAFLRHLSRCDVLIHMLSIPNYVSEELADEIIKDIDEIGEEPEAGAKKRSRGRKKNKVNCENLLAKWEKLEDKVLEEMMTNYRNINNELFQYDSVLVHKPQVIAMNKVDKIFDCCGLYSASSNQSSIDIANTIINRLRERLSKEVGHTRILPIAAKTSYNVADLVRRLRTLLNSIQKDNLRKYQSNQVIQDPTQDLSRLGDVTAEDTTEYPDGKVPFEIVANKRRKGEFRVVSEYIERAAAKMNFLYYEAIGRFQRQLSAWGVTKALKDLGAVAGDLILIGELEFDYIDENETFKWMTDMGISDIRPRQNRE